MDLNTLHSTVAATDRNDWTRITGRTANTAPIPPTMIEEVREDEYGRVELFHVRRHSELIVLRSDIDISVAWGMDVDPSSDATGRQPFYTEWAEKADWKLSYDFADLRYRGQLIERHVMVTVNGMGWSILPAANMELMHQEDVELPEIYRVSLFHYDLAQLLSSVTYADQAAFEHHFEYSETVIDG